MTKKNLKKYQEKKVDMIWVETPTNPTLKIIDIEKLSKLAKKVSALLVVENTFCSPIFQNPTKNTAQILLCTL